jgi:hypothetical protein
MKAYFLSFLVLLLFGKGVAQPTHAVFHDVAAVGGNKVIDDGFMVTTNISAISADTLQLQNGLAVQEADNFLNGRLDTGFMYFSANTRCLSENRKVIVRKGNVLSYSVIENSFLDPANHKKAFRLLLLSLLGIVIPFASFRFFSKRRYLRDVAYAILSAIEGGIYLWYTQSINADGFNLAWYERYSFVILFFGCAIILYLIFKIILFIYSYKEADKRRVKAENRIVVPTHVKTYKEEVPRKKLPGLTDGTPNKAQRSKIKIAVNAEIGETETPTTLKLLTHHK